MKNWTTVQLVLAGFIITVSVASLPALLLARGGHGHGHHAASTAAHAAASTSASATSSHGKCIDCARDSHGRIERSEKAIWQFRKFHPCPSTGSVQGACPGYVIDHVQALKHGGEDMPDNMQWQTVEAAKAKDKVE